MVVETVLKPPPGGDPDEVEVKVLLPRPLLQLGVETTSTTEQPSKTRAFINIKNSVEV